MLKSKAIIGKNPDITKNFLHSMRKRIGIFDADALSPEKKHATALIHDIFLSLLCGIRELH